MVRAKFSYDEPRFGSIEIEGDTTGIDNDFVIDQIERMYPEAVDIEIIEIEEISE